MDQRRRTLIAVVSIVVVVIAAALAGTYGSASGGCVSCHTQVNAAWAVGTHSSVPCVRCHVPASTVGRFGYGARVIAGMRLRIIDPSSRGGIAVADERCESCHAKVRKGSQAVGEAVRINHAECAPTDRCTRCHDRVTHGSDQRLLSGVDMFECLVCHTRTGATVACDVCHEGRLPSERIDSGTFAVTHGENWKRDHGMGSVVACAACHDDSKCAKCHGIGVPHASDFMRNHAAYAVTKGQKCKSCHQPTFCESCHGVPMPHPANFKMEHGIAAKTRGEALCKKCHAETDCLTCHTMHVHPGGAIGSAKP